MAAPDGTLNCEDFSMFQVIFIEASIDPCQLVAGGQRAESQPVGSSYAVVFIFHTRQRMRDVHTVSLREFKEPDQDPDQDQITEYMLHVV